MLRTRAPGVSLWEAVLPEVLRLSEELARVDALLDDPAFVDGSRLAVLAAALVRVALDSCLAERLRSG